MMGEKDMRLEDQRRMTTTIKMQGVVEDMTYLEERDCSTAVVAEPMDKYHGNDDHNHDGEK